MDTEMFFPGRGEKKKTEQAKAICKVCPVGQECLTFTLGYEQSHERYGIYGGLTQEERNQLFGVA